MRNATAIFAWQHFYEVAAKQEKEETLNIGEVLRLENFRMFHERHTKLHGSRSLADH